jgi:tetratricopeptide (TPR) repeat protein
LYNESGHPEQAIDVARQLTTAAPGQAAGPLLEARLRLADDETQEAVMAFREALERRPEEDLVIRIYGALDKAGAVSEGRLLLHDWVEQHPGHQDVGAFLQDVEQRSGKRAGAIAHYQRLLKTRSSHFVAMNELALIHYAEGDREKALEYARRAFNVAPEQPAIMDTFGWLLVESGDTSEGVALLERASAALPDSLEVSFHLAVGLARSGDTARAGRLLDQILNTGRAFNGIERAKALRKELGGG